MRGILAAALLGAAVGATGCHDLPDLGFCGNGIAEATLGEACDAGGDSAQCTATCELKCGAACPGTESVCAADGVCRAPSGQFDGSALPIRFDVDTAPVVGDVDGNGIDDLIGTNASQISTRFGFPAGDALFYGVDQLAPSATGPLHVFSRASSGAELSTVSVAVPNSGLSFLESDGVSFVPELHLTFPLDVPRRGAQFVVRDPQVRDAMPHKLGDVVMVADEVSTGVTAVRRLLIPGGTEPGSEAVPEYRLPPCGADPGGAWKTIGVAVEPTGDTFVVVTAQQGQLADSTRWNLCRYTVSNGAWVVSTRELTGGAPTSLALGNIDSADDQTSCSDLVYTTSVGLRFIAGSTDPQSTTAVPCELATSPEGSGAFDPDLVVLATAKLDPGSRHVVTSRGLYQYRSTGFERSLPLVGYVWSAAAVVDLNGDGVDDLVVARASDSIPRVALDDVDIVRGAGVLGSYRVDTTGPVTGVIGGDFDGDRVGDAVFLEASTIGTRVTASWGVRDGVIASPHPITPPRPNLIAIRLASFAWAPTIQADDGIDDLVLAERDVDGSGNLLDWVHGGILLGDARRVPMTPRFPSATQPGGSLVAVTTGAFDNDSATTRAVTYKAGYLPASLLETRVEQDDADHWDAHHFDSALTLAAPFGSFVSASGTLAAVTALTGAGAAVIAVVRLSAPTATPIVCRAATPGFTPLRYEGVDVNGDGDEELVAYYGGEVTSQRVVAYDVDDCRGAQLPEPLLVLPRCAALARVGTGLYGLCKDDAGEAGDGISSVVRITLQAGTPTPVLERVLGVPGGRRFLTAGDFDGDGIVDLAATTADRTGDGAAVTFLKQCTSADTRACERLGFAR